MFSSFKKIWSSSAPGPPPSAAPAQSANEGNIGNWEEDHDQSLVGPQSPRSPNSGIYEDALENIRVNGAAAKAGDNQQDDVPEASTVEAKTKKSKRSKKAKPVEEAITEENMQDTKILDVDTANAAPQIQKTVNGAAAKNSERLKGPKNSLNKSDLKLLRQNKENGIDGEEENALPQLKRSKKKNAAKVQERELSPVQLGFDNQDEMDDSTLLREQLSPAKPSLLHDITLKPNVEVHFTALEAMDIDSVPATATKKRKKKVTPASQGEESTKPKKKSKASEEKEPNGNIREIMDSQQEIPPISSGMESSRLEELARSSYLQFAEENASPPPELNSLEVVIPQSSSSQNVERPIFASQLAAKANKQSQPKVSGRRSSGWAAINVQGSLESILEPEPAQAPLQLQEEPEIQQSVVQQPVIEEEPKTLTRKSSARKKRTQKEVSAQPNMEQEIEEPVVEPQPKSTTKKSSTQKKKARKESLTQPDVEQIEEPEVQHEPKSLVKKSSTRKKKASKEASPQPDVEGEIDIEEPELQHEPKSSAKTSSARKKKAQVELNAEVQGDEEVQVPPLKSSGRKKRAQNESLAQAEIEEEAIEEFPSATPKSSTRKRRRLPVNSKEPAEASSSQPASSKSTKNAKTAIQTPVAATVTTPVPPRKGSEYGTGRQKGVRLTQAHIQKINDAVEVYRGMQGLEIAEMIAYIQQDIIKEESKTDFWKYVHDEVPDLTRRKVIAYCRRNFHNFKRGPWTEEEDQEMETIINTIDNTTGLSKTAMWKTVGDLLNRYNEDCRDRWRTYCACKDRKTGPWNLEEEAKLREIVREVQETAYNVYRETGETKLSLEDFEPDYTLVSKKMGTRTRLQCMNKWKNILDRENEDGHNPLAEAPVSKSAWRQVPALEAARVLSTDEKYNILSLIRASGAAREGKVPWATFPDSKGNVMIWRTFVRGAIYTIPNYEDMSFQERIEHLLTKFESNEPVKIDEQADEFLRLADYKLRSGKWKLSHDSNLSSRFVRDDDDDDDDDQETGAEIPERNFRSRMKKQGESQDANAVEEEDPTTHQQEVAEVMDEIRDSHKKRKVTTSNIPEKVLDEDQDEEPQLTPIGKKKLRGTKKAKKSTTFEDASVDQDIISSQALIQAQNKEGESEAPDPTPSRKKDKKRKSKKTNPIEEEAEGEVVEETVDAIAEQEEGQDPMEADLDAGSSRSLEQAQNEEGGSEVPGPSQAPNEDKKRKSKKTIPIEEAIVEEEVNGTADQAKNLESMDLDLDVVDASSSLKPKKSWRSKKIKPAKQLPVEGFEVVNGTADQEQDQDPMGTNPGVEIPSSLKPKKSKKSKKSRKLISDEDLKQIHEEIALAEAMSASASPEKRKRSKRDRIAEEPVETVPEHNSELINGQEEYVAEDADDYDYEDPFRNLVALAPETKKKLKKSKTVQSFEEQASDDLFDEGHGISNDYHQEANGNKVPSVADDLEDPEDPIEYTPESDDPVAQFNDGAQDEGLHDQESLDLDNTGNAMPTDDEEDYDNAYDNLVDSHYANPSYSDNDVSNEESVDDIPDGDYLDEEHTITTNGFRTQVSPELEGIAHEVSEPSITYPRLPTPPSAQHPRTSDKASKKDKKRKRLSSQVEQPASNEVGGSAEKKLKKRKVDVREAQAKWERLQPREYFGLEADEESDYGSGQQASLSEDSDGSDTSIPARVPPKNSKSTKVSRAKRGRMQ